MEQEKSRHEEITRAFFDDDGYVKLSGMELVYLTEEKAVVRAEIKSCHLNANGYVQGGMLFTMGDFAFAALANYLHPATVTQGGHIAYMRPANTKYVTATAREITRAGHNTVSEVIITDDKDEVLCVCQFNGFVKDVNVCEWTWKRKNK